VALSNQLLQLGVAMMQHYSWALITYSTL